MTDKELKSIMGKQFGFADDFMKYYKKELLKGKLDVLGLGSILEIFPEFSSLVRKPNGYRCFNLDEEACFLLRNPFMVVDSFTGNIRGDYIDPNETYVTMLSDKVFQVTYETKVNGVEEYLIRINLNTVHIVPFISVYCAMASLSRYVNVKERVVRIVLSDGKFIMASSVFSNWELVSKGTIRVKDIAGEIIDFSVLDIVEVSK